MADERGLRVQHDLCIPADEIHESASRSSGPGGQHVNKTETRVTLRWNVRESRVLSETRRRRLLSRLDARLTRRGHLVVHAQQHRSRGRNRELARERLAELVRDALVVRRARVATAPSRGQRRRRLEDKRRRSAVKRTRSRPRGDDG
ncbi:MAG: alternative ribosome rescue aminoacyl-tRNA hydrolase ArfB [Myxococcota bacterium]